MIFINIYLFINAITNKFYYKIINFNKLKKIAMI